MENNYPFSIATQKNYTIAKEYYKQRRNMLNKLFEKDKQEYFKEIVEYIDTKIKEYQENVVKKVFEELSRSNDHKYYYNGTVEKLEDMSFEVKNIIEKIGSAGMYQRNIASLLGNQFEDFMEQALGIDELSKIVPNEAINVIESLVEGFAKKGNITSTSATVSGKKNIRPDLGLNMKIQYDEDNKIAKTNDGKLNVEFRTLVDLDELDLTDISLTNETLERYLSTNSFGFSMKLWKDGNNKEFSQSSVLQKMINTQLEAPVGESGERLSWETNYTEAFVVYQLSKYLLNIIGPMNVGLISGDKYIWMDEFIDNRIFYMTVQAENSFEKSRRGAGYEIIPKISDPSIKIRALNNSMQYFKTSFSKKTKRISIVNRRIIKT